MISSNRQSPAPRKRGGFSLIELVIVVVIIGIIGAIAIPRMSRGAAGASDSALTANLAVLRNALDLYAAEHNGNFPKLADMPEALTQYTDAAGTVSATKTSTAIFGPYIRNIPPLPVGPNKGDATFTATADTPPTAASAGWVYNETTGAVVANAGTLKDATDTSYSEY